MNEEIYTRWSNDFSLPNITKLNNTGGVIEEMGLEGGNVSKVLVSRNQIIYAYRGLNPRSYKKYNQTGALLYESFTSDRATNLVENEIGGITAYSSDLIMMDSNLNIKWQYTHEEIYPGIPDDGHIGSDIIQTEDGGCVITGYITDEFFSGVFMSKYTSEGERLWGGSYPSDVLPMTYLHQVKEVSGGLVVLGGNKFTEEIWLVKLYSDGNWVTNTEDLLEVESGMMVYPNPGKGNLNIKFSEKVTGEINILNSQGQIIKKITIHNKDTTQEILSNIPSGFYWIEFIGQSGNSSTKKYIKN